MKIIEFVGRVWSGMAR